MDALFCSLVLALSDVLCCFSWLVSLPTCHLREHYLRHLFHRLANDGNNLAYPTSCVYVYGVIYVLWRNSGSFWFLVWGYHRGQGGPDQRTERETVLRKFLAGCYIFGVLNSDLLLSHGRQSQQSMSYC